MFELFAQQYALDEKFGITLEYPTHPNPNPNPNLNPYPNPNPNHN